MNRNLIKKYSSQITEEQLTNFALKNKVELTNTEKTTLLYILHDDIDAFLNNPKEYLESSRHHFSDEVYKKIIELYDKYSIYLI